MRVKQAKPDLQSASLPLQILALLKPGALTVADVAESLDGNESSIRSALNRLEDRGKVVRLISSDGGSGKKTQWGLRVAN